MKKLTLAICMVIASFSLVSAEMGFKIGVSAQVGSFETSASETNTADATTEKSKTQEALFGTAGFFAEQRLHFLPGPLSRLSVGYDNIINDMDLGTATNTRLSRTGNAAGTEDTVNTNHSVNAKIDGMTTMYATLTITDWLYLKAGQVDVDLTTAYKGTNTSSYPTSHTLDGSMFGAGVHLQNDNGIFFRLEVNDYDIDGKTVNNAGTDSDFQVKLNASEGTTGRMSIGKAF